MQQETEVDINISANKSVGTFLENVRNYETFEGIRGFDDNISDSDMDEIHDNSYLNCQSDPSAHSDHGFYNALRSVKVSKMEQDRFVPQRHENCVLAYDVKEVLFAAN